MVGDNKVADADDSHDTSSPALNFQDEIGCLQANPAPQIPLFGVTAIIEETHDGWVIFGGPPARPIFGRHAQCHAVRVATRHGAQRHAAGERFAAFEIELQGVQSQCGVRFFAGQPAEQQHAGAGRFRHVGLAVQQCRDGRLGARQAGRIQAPQAAGGGDQLLQVFRDG